MGCPNCGIEGDAHWDTWDDDFNHTGGGCHCPNCGHVYYEWYDTATAAPTTKTMIDWDSIPCQHDSKADNWEETCIDGRPEPWEKSNG